MLEYFIDPRIPFLQLLYHLEYLNLIKTVKSGISQIQSLYFESFQNYLQYLLLRFKLYSYLKYYNNFSLWHICKIHQSKLYKSIFQGPNLRRYCFECWECLKGASSYQYHDLIHVVGCVQFILSKIRIDTVSSFDCWSF